MQASGGIAAPVDRVCHAIVLGWTLVVCSPELHNTLLPNLQWYVTALATPALLILAPPRGLWRGAPGLTAALGLTLALTLSAFASAEPLRAAVHAVKIAAVWLLLYPLLFARPSYARTALRGCLAAAALNFVLIALAAAGGFAVAGPSGSGRWGTLLNAPGTLAQLGGFALAFGLAHVSSQRRPSLSQAGLSLAAAALIVLDGSRTAFLGAVVMGLFVIAAVRGGGALQPATARRSRPLPWIGLAAMTALPVALWIGWNPLREGVEHSFDLVAAQRMGEVVEGRHGVASLAAFLERIDEPRYRAMLNSIEAIRRSPLEGEGLGSTMSPGFSQQITIHNAYLQAWADVGLLGFVSYCALTLAWIPRLPRYLRQVARLSDRGARAHYYGAATALVFYCWWGLFQGISVDPSAWIYFQLPAIYFAKLVDFRPPRRQSVRPKSRPGVIAAPAPLRLASCLEGRSR